MGLFYNINDFSSFNKMILKFIVILFLFLIFLGILSIMDSKFYGNRFHTILLFTDEYIVYKTILKHKEEIEIKSTRGDQGVYKYNNWTIFHLKYHGEKLLWINDGKRIIFSYYNKYYSNKIREILNEIQS